MELIDNLQLGNDTYFFNFYLLVTINSFISSNPLVEYRKSVVNNGTDYLVQLDAPAPVRAALPDRPVAESFSARCR